VDRRSKEATTTTANRHAIPLRDPETDFEATSIPAVLDRLFSANATDPRDYIAPGNIQGLQVHVERTTAGFLVTLRGTPQAAYNKAKQIGEPNKYEILSRTTIPAKISYAKLRRFPNRKAVFSGILASPAPTPRFIAAMAEAITDRLTRESTGHNQAGAASGALLPDSQDTRDKPKSYYRSPDRSHGSPRSLKVTITTAKGERVTTYLAEAIAIIQNEDLSRSLPPYYTINRRIKRGWDPRKAITTPRNITKEPQPND
jgi:hypothetical protein